MDSNGLILNIYKYMGHTVTEFEPMENIYHKHASSAEHERMITFGNYDRTSVDIVDSISTFAERSSQAYHWFGNQQSIMLFSVESKHNSHIFTAIQADAHTGLRIMQNRKSARSSEEHISLL